MKLRLTLLATLLCADVALAQEHNFCTAATEICPADSAGYNNIAAWNLATGAPYVPPSGSTTWLGTFDYFGSTYLAACIEEPGGTNYMYFLYNTTTSTYLSSLTQDSFYCAGAGHDEIWVQAPGTSRACGSDTLYGFADNGRSFDLFGGAGNDELHGESVGSPDLLCGGPGNDQLWDGQYSDGWDGDDFIFNVGVQGYGYRGCDRIRCGSFGATCGGEQHSDCVMEFAGSAAPTGATISCDSGADYTPHSTGTLSCESSHFNCSAWSPGAGDSCS